VDLEWAIIGSIRNIKCWHQMISIVKNSCISWMIVHRAVTQFKLLTLQLNKQKLLKAKLVKIYSKLVEEEKELRQTKMC